MENFTRTKEGGSVITFIVVGVVLTALVIGGIYTLRRSGHEQPASSPAPSAAKNPSTTTPSPGGSTQSPAAGNQKPGSTNQPPVSTTPRTGNAPLPKTGPTDNLVNMLMLAMLVGMVASYVQSQRARLAQLAATRE